LWDDIGILQAESAMMILVFVGEIGAGLPLEVEEGDSCSKLRGQEFARGRACERKSLGKERLVGRRRFDYT
jgi:hypothetical protein